MVSGSGDLKISADAKDLNVKISGSGNIALNDNSNNTNVRISGSGDVLLAGTGNDVNVNISGSGELNAEKFKTKTYGLTITRSRKYRINVEEEIKSNITCSGSVYYKSDPKRLNNHTSGSGKIKKIL